MSDFTPMYAEEEAAVIDLWHRCGLTRPWNDPVADIARTRAGAASDILIHRQGVNPIASVMVGHDGHRAWVYYVATHPDHRRKGLGKAAMVAAEAWAKARGMPKLHLMVRPGNDAAVAFYAALGYDMGTVRVMEKWLVTKPGGAG